MSFRRQTWALIWRYCIAQRRTPIKTTIKLIIWPAICLGLYFYFVKMMQENTETKDNFNGLVETFSVGVLQLALVFNFYSYLCFMITDKSSGMKSLMISVGLQKAPYYVANIICYMISSLPIILFVGITASIYLFEGSSATGCVIIILYIVFAVHLCGLVFVFNSLFKSPNLASLVLIGAFLEPLIHSLVTLVGPKTSIPSIVLFVASADPYESIRLFGESYKTCKNNGTNIIEGGATCVSSGLLLTAMVFWTVISYLFAIWFDQACPWQTDTAYRGLCFCFKSSSPPLAQDGDLELPQRSRNSKYFERSVSSREVGICVKKVSKDFSGKRVVDDISFNIYRGETTLLLGHNGAGKTTLMNMILGKLMPNSGYVRISGINGRSSDIGIGVCPQLSVYDDFLSVRQHMALFSDIKSDLARDVRRHDIETTLHDVSMDKKADSLPHELSGGMKRKLSLGMAFVGKSSILILDEPSSGLDPDSRVFVWNAIRRYRADRTVLLSTQHMEEADYLGDRIAIMSEGKIICCGSSVFLTKLFGSGYKLRVECLESKRQLVTDLARRYFTKVKLSDNEHIVRPSENEEGVLDMVLELNDDSDRHLEEKLIGLLEYIETNHQKLGIKSHGLRSSSIEDVLLNTTNLLQEEAKDSVRLSLNTSMVGQLKTVVNPPIRQSSSWCMDQMAFACAIFKKHISTYKRDWKSILLMRVALVAFVCWLMADSLINTSTYAYILIVHFISYPVRENVSKFKIMQLNTMANVCVYWISQLVVDMLTIVVALIFFNLFIELKLHDNIEDSRIATHLIASAGMILFGIAGAFNCYVLSTFFSETKTGLGYAILYFTVPIIVSIFLFVLKMIPNITNALDSVERALDWIFIIVYPTKAYSYLLNGLIVDNYIKMMTVLKRTGGLSPITTGFLVLTGQAVAFGLILYLIEAYNLDPSSWLTRCCNQICCCLRQRPATNLISPEGQIDEDVLDERRKARVAISNNGDSYRLVAHDLCKSYVPGVRVVDHLSFTVNKGECFGLLGVNGAGKSTTFSMLVGERRQDSGKIWLKGIFSDVNIHSYRKRLGYDPQESPEFSLSPVEALYLMARLRKVDEQHISGLVHCLLLVLDMSEHANKNFDELSGGTKRKLALGMSLIGNQEMLALDEPTAGVDPIARRGVWQLLRSLRSQKQVSVIISSHAMEECEAICDRISIMSRGRLRCIGTFLHLRNKFSHGCTVRIQFSPSETVSDFSSSVVPDLTRRLQQLVGYSVRLADVNINSATFNILTKDFKRSALFRLLKDFNQTHKNLSYIVNDSSLEDIFLTMAREQQPIEASPSSSSSKRGRSSVNV